MSQDNPWSGRLRTRPVQQAQPQDIGGADAECAMHHLFDAMSIARLVVMLGLFYQSQYTSNFLQRSPEFAVQRVG
jgi:hypothetical protein